MDRTYLKLHGFGNVHTEFAKLVLERMNHAYVGLLRLTLPFDELDSSPRFVELFFKEWEYNHTKEIWVQNTDFVDKFYHEDLILNGVRLQSPGFWEFVGKLNPLETIRTYLNDRHERIKDNTYRNELEKEKLSTENKILKLKLIDRYVETAKKAGLSESQIAGIVRDNALIPLLKLESLQDSRIITYAEIPEQEGREESNKIEA